MRLAVAAFVTALLAVGTTIGILFALLGLIPWGNREFIELLVVHVGLLTISKLCSQLYELTQERL